jgi:hypothetical protein
MAVSSHIDFHDKRWEENIHTQLVHSDEAAPMLMLVFLETVKGIAEGKDMQAIPDEDAFIFERDYGQACAKDWSKGVVPHANGAAGNGPVGYECRYVGNQVIHCTHVGNQETCAMPELVGDECNRMRRRVVEKGYDVFWELNRANASGVDGRGVVAAGGGRREVGTCVVGGNVMSTWIHGNVGV